MILEILIVRPLQIENNEVKIQLSIVEIVDVMIISFIKIFLYFIDYLHHNNLHEHRYNHHNLSILPSANLGKTLLYASALSFLKYISVHK